MFEHVELQLQIAIVMQLDDREKAEMFVQIAAESRSKAKDLKWFVKVSGPIRSFLKVISDGEERAGLFMELDSEHKTFLMSNVSAGDRAEMFAASHKLSLGVPVTSITQFAIIQAGSAANNAEFYALLPNELQMLMLPAMETEDKAKMFEELSLEQQKTLCL